MINIKKFLLDIVLHAKLPRSARKAIRQLNDDSICIDAGANVGTISEIFAKSGAMVYAFEPDSIAFEKLRSKAIKYNNIIIENKAVGTENVRRKLFKHKSKSPSNSIDFSQASSLMKDKPNVNCNNFEYVDVIDLSIFISTLKRVDILKIDIEGSEILLVPHLIKTGCLEKVDLIFVETHDRKWPGLSESTKNMLDHALESRYANKFNFNWI